MYHVNLDNLNLTKGDDPLELATDCYELIMPRKEQVLLCKSL